MHIRKSVVSGGVAGIIIALITVIFARLNAVWGNGMARGIINFVAAVPTFISAAKLKLPQAFQNIFFFVYWALAGAIIGWFLCGKRAAFKAAAIIFVVAVIILHRIVQINLQQELGGALQALGEIFGGKMK